MRPKQWPRDLWQENLKGDRPLYLIFIFLFFIFYFSKDYPMRMRASVSKVHDKLRSPTNINQGDRNLTQHFNFF